MIFLLLIKTANPRGYYFKIALCSLWSCSQFGEAQQKDEHTHQNSEIILSLIPENKLFRRIITILNISNESLKDYSMMSQIINHFLIICRTFCTA
jgi:hypothetical protein